MPRPMLAQIQKKLVDWNLSDPKGKSIADVPKIRDEIEKRVNGAIKEPTQGASFALMCELK